MNFENKEKYTAGNEVLSCAPGWTKRKRSLQQIIESRTVDSIDFNEHWGIFGASNINGVCLVKNKFEYKNRLDLLLVIVKLKLICIQT